MPKASIPERRAEYIWFDGDFVTWEEANVHVLSHVIHYGSSVFEGIRCYGTPEGPKVFRLREHVDRLFYSATVSRMDIDHTPEEITDVCLDAVARNGFDSCYIRPVVFRGAGGMGLFPQGCPIHTVVAAWEWGAYLGAEGLEKGIDAMVSTWRKTPPGSIPTMIKLGGAYTLSTLAKMEAQRLGFAEALLLDTEGRVAEGTGENLFAVIEGQLLTPPLGYSILGGLTRKSIIRLARDQGLDVVEQPLTREFLHLADELFLTGTAAEVTAIRSVDGIAIGTGKMGPITRGLQTEFFDIVNGRKPDRHRWLTPVAAAATQGPRA